MIVDVDAPKIPLNNAVGRGGRVCGQGLWNV